MTTAGRYGAYGYLGGSNYSAGLQRANTQYRIVRAGYLTHRHG